MDNELRSNFALAFQVLSKEIENETERSEQIENLKQERKQALDGVGKLKTLLAELEKQLNGNSI